MKNSMLSLALGVPLLALGGCDAGEAESPEQVGLPDPVEPDETVNAPPADDPPPSDLGGSPAQRPMAPPPGQQPPPGQLGEPAQPGATGQPIQPVEPAPSSADQPGAAPGTPTQ